MSKPWDKGLKRLVRAAPQDFDTLVLPGSLLLEELSTELHSRDNQAWLKRRFAVFHEILEDSWAYKEIAEKAREKGRGEGLREGLQQGLQQGLEGGLKKGLEQGLEQGLQQGLIEALLVIIETRFPTLLPQANAFAERVHDPLTLRHVVVTLTLAQNAEEAAHSLSNGNGTSS